MKPIVDELEHKYAGKLRVIRLDIQSDIGKSFAPKYGFRGTPTFVFIGPDGEVLFHQFGKINPDPIREFIEN